jgi:hypothetical protein
MSEIVTLEISEEAVQLARDIAARTGRNVAAILSEWIDRSVAEVPIETLSDEQVLALSDQQMNEQDQTNLSQLLADQREGRLDKQGKAYLEKHMQTYRRGLVRKAQALNIAQSLWLLSQSTASGHGPARNRAPCPDCRGWFR